MSLLFILGCSGFPYTGVIKESTRFVQKVHPEAFKVIEKNGEKLHYVQLGAKNKPILLLIHGSPGSWKSFAHFYKDERLLSDFDIITYDRMGFGDNRAGKPHLSLDDHLIVPLEVLNLKENEKREVIIVGHSYGGPVAAKLASILSNRVRKLILVAASMDPELEKMKWYQHVGKLPIIRSLIPSTLDVVNREILGLKAELLKLESQYPIQKDTRIIHGAIDKLVPVENVEYMKRNFPQFKLRVIKEMRHFVPWSFPHLIKEEIY